MAAPSGRTPIRGYPYPLQNDDVDVSRDIQALAVAFDNENSGGGGPTGGGALKAAPVLDVGVAGQIRAGRQLTVADFTALGLSAPVGLWNLSDLSNLGSGGALVNKGAVPFAPGINGVATTAAQFAGSTGQALYIADAGAADPFRIRTGSWGCWFRTAKRGVVQQIVTKANAFRLWVSSGNMVVADISADGAAILASVVSVSDVCDDRWHFAISTYDGAMLKIYVDGTLETSTSFPADATIFPSASPFNIGAQQADGATSAVQPHYGRVDEAFVSADVLSDAQVRMLCCAKIPHAYGATPARVALSVRRARKGGPLLTADFPVAPVRLHNFTNGALGDQGSGGVALTANQGTGAIVPVAGADGASSGGYSFSGAHSGLSSTDAGLPAALAARTYGVWVKTVSTVGAGLFGWGTLSTADARIWLNAGGAIGCSSGTDLITTSFISDGAWHQAICVENNAAGDGVRRKLYVDSRLVGSSTVMNPLTLVGANGLRIGANPDGSAPVPAQFDGAFVCAAAFTQDQISALWAKGSQALSPSPKEAGDHVEGMDATNIYSILDLPSQHLIDLRVAS